MIFLSGIPMGCATSRGGEPAVPNPGPGDSAAAISRSAPPAFRVIYLIHGDADYAWHDSTGRGFSADREALRQAVETAEASPAGEYFIFHQRSPQWRLFGNRGDGTFLRYRDGALVRSEQYVRGTQPHDFSAEAALFRARVGNEDSSPPLIFAYFGHEIPVLNQKGYSASNRDDGISVVRFTTALARFSPAPVPPLAAASGPPETSPASRPFDLVILSTCYGGNPAMMRALSPLADRTVASPAYLHLSYLDTRALADLGRGLASRPGPDAPGDRYATPQDVQKIADTIAARSFEGLKQRTQTEITVAVYDLGETRWFLESFSGNGSGRSAARESPWRDCVAYPRFDSTAAARGVSLRYRPPRFGAGRDVASRSAWQCPD